MSKPHRQDARAASADAGTITSAERTGERKQINIRVDEDTYSKALTTARLQKMSLPQYMQKLLEDDLDEITHDDLNQWAVEMKNEHDQEIDALVASLLPEGS